MTPADIALLLLVSSVAGALNSIAGGGSFISFPTLMFLGMPSVEANATNTTALWPGTIASTGAYRKALSRELLVRMFPLAITTLIGSLVGAWLLLHTHPRTFDKLVPWLLFAGTLLFTVRDKVSAWASTRQERAPRSTVRVAWIALVQGILGIYVGYFGAGVGIVMLPLLVLMGVDDIHAISGLRTLLVTCGNAVAVALFTVAGAVKWPYALVMMVGAILGGYGGAYLAQKLPAKTVGYVVIAIGYGMTAYFFWKTYLRR